ncbi:hypothetical protein EGR_11112 [Echinococcus granulosus]|uniref:Uncharacterized protein n=1 Tax=Echinococcus granulosus TaxID=6210 RepID=W6UKL1_ECHGR|nr:hypothetical protein EGR_11112 [Echinococcus granulosus]EUB54029.1 hypothetical protein EGR_11112 [Echinococcus granulosus]
MGIEAFARSLAQVPQITSPFTPYLSLRADPPELVLDVIIALSEVRDCFAAKAGAKVLVTLFKRFAFIIFEGVGAASPDVTSNYKEPETGVVHPFGQLVDSARIDSDPKCNEYVAYDTCQIEQRCLAWINP